MRADERRPPVQMTQLLAGFQLSHALYAAAVLGVADHLVAGPAPVAVLAEHTRAHAPSLHRLLRTLAMRELQSDRTSSGTLCRGWLYLPEGVTRPGARAITGSAVLVVLPSLMQSLLAGLGDDHAIYGGLHAAHPGHRGYLYVRSRQRER